MLAPHRGIRETPPRPFPAEVRRQPAAPLLSRSANRSLGRRRGIAFRGNCGSHPRESILLSQQISHQCRTPLPGFQKQLPSPTNSHPHLDRWDSRCRQCTRSGLTACPQYIGPQTAATGLVLIEEVILPVPENWAIGVVHPIATRKKMILRAERVGDGSVRQCDVGS